MAYGVFLSVSICFFFFFFNDTATTEIYTILFVGSVRCVQETEQYLIRKWNQINNQKRVGKKRVENKHSKLKMSIGKNNHLNDHLTKKKNMNSLNKIKTFSNSCLLYTSPSPRDRQKSRMPSSA
eukprot:TRINITY_DN2339_c0_g1_i1.p2 TRINITY_DN2339_c0_g1~~TRINITY_DN2339_c0_g1_i1.p2  ORF type:complete len:124 (-),score=27.90 TRINITY_DN2339_c0_g1_i1:20-391(-)